MGGECEGRLVVAVTNVAQQLTLPPGVSAVAVRN
jgi:hypothetical protein